MDVFQHRASHRQSGESHTINYTGYSERERVMERVRERGSTAYRVQLSVLAHMYHLDLFNSSFKRGCVIHPWTWT